MKLTATIIPSVQAGIQAELRDIERAVAAGTRDAGRGLRTELRRQVTSAGLGLRLANSWRDPSKRRRWDVAPANVRGWGLHGGYPAGGDVDPRHDDRIQAVGSLHDLRPVAPGS
jgi:hypothetical protein